MPGAAPSAPLTRLHHPLPRRSAAGAAELGQAAGLQPALEADAGSWAALSSLNYSNSL